MQTLAKLLRVPIILLWVGIIYLSLLLSHNAILYFTHGGEYGILPEKVFARQDPLWNACFYLHLPSGIVCLLLPWVSFAKKTFHLRSVHEWMGKIYVIVTLFIVCPTGMYLALYAKGGVITQVGFLVQGFLLIWFTYYGYVSVRNSGSIEHLPYMIRSYSIALVVLTFRVLHIAFFLLNIPYEINYAISQWLGLSLNMLIAEVIILVMAKRHLSPFKKQLI